MREIFVILLLCLPALQGELKFHEEKVYHTPRSLTNKQLLNTAVYYNDSYFEEALSKIMIPRVVGTSGHEKVKQYILNELRRLQWNLEEDSFLAETPNHGKLEFTNIIARLNPNARRYLVLACHYDSKFFPNQEFLGATDSAVPCAMLLHLAKVLNDPLSSSRISNLSLMLIFFDGEEAFHEWSPSDSLYGSRNLAAKWSLTPFPESNSTTHHLDGIDLLMLLDLLGARNPTFYSYFPNTARWHSLLVNIERRLRSLGVVPQNQPYQFLEKSTFSSIEDDHIPFLVRNVPILHIIPNPFPDVWHKLSDNYAALDIPTIRSTSNIIHSFVLSYLMGDIPR